MRRLMLALGIAGFIAATALVAHAIDPSPPNDQTAMVQVKSDILNAVIVDLSPDIGTNVDSMGIVLIANSDPATVDTDIGARAPDARATSKSDMNSGHYLYREREVMARLPSRVAGPTRSPIWMATSIDYRQDMRRLARTSASGGHLRL